jgi:predicted nucleotidyltransferase
MIRYERLPTAVLARVPELEDRLNAEPRVLFAYLFGGLARGAQGSMSDVDLAVYLTEGVEDGAFLLDLFSLASDALGTSEVDLVVLNQAPVSLVGRILKDRRVLCDKDPSFRAAYESRKLREFFDFRFKEEELFRMRYGHGG